MNSSTATPAPPPRKRMHLMTVLALTWSLASIPSAVNAAAMSRDDIYNANGFLQNWVAPFPDVTVQSTSVTAAQTYIVQNWQTVYKSIQVGGQDLVFVQDPFASSTVNMALAAASSNKTTTSTTTTTTTKTTTSAPPATTSANSTDATINGSGVLEVKYPAGSYVPSMGPVPGGVQFYSAPFGQTDMYSKMMISYDVAFPAGFNWVLGGKLPGVYGGSNHEGCSGGNQSTGADCLTARLMWRPNGVGEVYAYIPADASSNFCKSSNVMCNDQYGKSIGRGLIYFPAGAWTHLDVVMDLNEPAGTANGLLKVYLNGNLVINMNNVPYRTTGQVGFQGLMFSSFFGGSDPTYATPVDTVTYYRNLQMSVGAPAVLYDGPGNDASKMGGTTVFALVALVASVMFVL